MHIHWPAARTAEAEVSGKQGHRYEDTFVLKNYVRRLNAFAIADSEHHPSTPSNVISQTTMVVLYVTRSKE